MQEIQLYKHGFFFVKPFICSILIFIIISPAIFVNPKDDWMIGPLAMAISLLPLIWAFLRFKLDKIEIKNGQLYSRIGLINIDTKTIALNKISMVSAKKNLITMLFDFGTIEIQSSAINSTITYPYIANITQIVNIINGELNTVK